MNMQESPLRGSLIQDFNSIAINQNGKILNGGSMVAEEQEELMERLNKQNEEEASLRNRKLKPYEQGD